MIEHTSPNRSRRRDRRAWLLGAVLAIAVSAAPLAAANPALKDAVAQQVRRAQSSIPSLGVTVADVATGEELYAYNGDQLQIIASNTKLVTTAAVLDALGPGYFFETPLLARGRIENGILYGDLAVVGGGDPTISERWTGDAYAPFRRWARALHERGIQRVEGDLFLFHGRFHGPLVHPDWPRDQLAKWYEAPIDALSYNDNCVWVQVSPTDRGQPRIDLRPVDGLLTIQNRAQMTGSAKAHRVIVQREPESTLIEVHGSVYRKAQPLDAWVTVPDPALYFGATLRQTLSRSGIEVSGRLRPLEALPMGAWERIAIYRSGLPLALEVTNKRSQNFYAETLLRTLGVEHCGEGTWEAGLRGAAEFLERIGIAPGTYSMADGSGMSRNNRFSSRQLVTLLRAMYYHRWGREFLRSLPFSGEEDLSWERRLAEAPYRGNVFAKTGTLNGVSTLSGYAKGRSGRLYVFSILANRTPGAWQARQVQDRIVRAIIDNG